MSVKAAQPPVTEVPATVPVIDFNDLNDPVKRSEVIAQVRRASETIGFFEIINSGVPKKVMDEAFDSNRDFFQIPAEEKFELSPDLKGNTPKVPVFKLGYKLPVMPGGVKGCNEQVVFRSYHKREGPEEFYTNGDKSQADLDSTLNWWPKNPTDYREKVESLFAELGKLGDTMLDVFSESLDLPPTFLRLEHHKNATVPRYCSFHHYPKSTQAKTKEIGLMPHRDSSIFSFVSQGYDGTSGLWINPYGEWIPVVPREGSIIVNVGDILQAWTNGRFKSILHRVISDNASERHSFAYFCFPAVPGKTPDAEPDFIVEPIPKLINEKNPPSYKPFAYIDFYNKKMRVNSISLLASHQVKASA